MKFYHLSAASYGDDSVSWTARLSSAETRSSSGRSTVITSLFSCRECAFAFVLFFPSVESRSCSLKACTVAYRDSVHVTIAFQSIHSFTRRTLNRAQVPAVSTIYNNLSLHPASRVRSIWPLVARYREFAGDCGQSDAPVGLTVNAYWLSAQDAP
ncbi:hypothetical protein PYCCODRAFT_11797 [Trametes coccinea BRFM310]|uniref:Uncharacterized protein n=1 Tax=Trametes coccinea (strain BRFM310) TaxID=1353009 RepID=A0A1Y2J7X4_TRAC3|nr:hypothetical protein PYCCODRAFT_11797 [Trametes coccinea BRFM310]